MRLTLSTVIVGTAASVLMLAVNIKAGQAPGTTATPTAAAPKPPAQAGPSRPGTTTTARPPAGPTAKAQPVSAAAFEAATKSLFADTCMQCHNRDEVAGGLDLAQYSAPSSLMTDRDEWDKILAKLKSREMPPADVERPDAEINALVKLLDTEF